MPNPVSPPDVYYNVTGDVELRGGCQLDLIPGKSQTVCYLPRANATWSEVDYSLCATCFSLDIGWDNCSKQLKNNPNLIISASRAKCSATISINVRL